MATNAQILSAVINKWAQPLLNTLIQPKLSSLPGMQLVENKARQWFGLSPEWNLTRDLAPLTQNISGRIVIPMLSQYLSKVDDASLPNLAHAIVDKALENGELNLFEGKVVFETADLQELKKLLDINLPMTEEEVYEVKTE